MRNLSPIDRLLATAGAALSTVAGPATRVRAFPQGESTDDAALSEADRSEAAALMRVNHVGEVCAQALYAAQALSAREERLRAHYDRAAAEEGEHLDWTAARIAELGGRPSLLNPLWYAGAFGIGLLAGRLGDRASLGFVIETERQVEQHLQGHLTRLPIGDTRSRAIVSRMRDDEARHAHQAEQAGGVRPPPPVRWLMRAAAKVMTTTAHRV